MLESEIVNAKIVRNRLGHNRDSNTECKMNGNEEVMHLHRKDETIPDVNVETLTRKNHMSPLTTNSPLCDKRYNETCGQQPRARLLHTQAVTIEI